MEGNEAKTTTAERTERSEPGIRPSRLAQTAWATEASRAPMEPDEPDKSGSTEPKAAEAPPQTARKRILKECWSWIWHLGLAFLIGLLLTRFVVQRNAVEGRSMQPTLQPGDQLLVEKLSPHFHGLKRGDIITFVLDRQGLKEDLVKRIVGMPGEKVAIQDGHVWIDGQLLEEAYLPQGTLTQADGDSGSEWTLAADQYFVLGDNRSMSLDSRFFGPVPARDILGEVWVRLYPFDHFGSVH